MSESESELGAAQGQGTMEHAWRRLISRYPLMMKQLSYISSAAAISCTGTWRAKILVLNIIKINKTTEVSLILVYLGCANTISGTVSDMNFGELDLTG